jgi:SAM-dependent methyltransferase
VAVRCLCEKNTFFQPDAFKPKAQQQFRDERGSLVMEPQPAGLEAFQGMASHAGRCNVCGKQTLFFYSDEAQYRESLVCAHCLTTSRYRSLARGILLAIRELTGVEAQSLAELEPEMNMASLRIYDTQVPFYFRVAYPLPDLLSRCKWIDVQTSTYRPKEMPGATLGANITNENLEALSFPDNSFDIVITSDVMEHVRLDYKAHWEIRRVLKPGGFYLFTVPHFRGRKETFYRVAVVDSYDATKDIYLAEKEYHGDTNSEEGGVLSYRSYGTEIDGTLDELGFTVEYTNEDFPGVGIYNTELFFCRLAK